MMQPPRSTVILQPHPRSGVSWFIPKLCPSSWARVTAAPRGFSEWSWENPEHRYLITMLGVIQFIWFNLCVTYSNGAVVYVEIYENQKIIKTSTTQITRLCVPLFKISQVCF